MWKLKKDLPGVKAGEIGRKDLSLNTFWFGSLVNPYSFSEDFMKACPDFFEKVPDDKWEPKDGEVVWMIFGVDVERHYFGTDRDVVNASFGNCFRTREQAERARDLVRETLRKFQEELNTARQGGEGEA